MQARKHWLALVASALGACTSTTSPSDGSLGPLDASADAAAYRADANAHTDDAGPLDAPSDASEPLPPTRIYVTLVTHNEDTATGSNPECVALFEALDARFAANRDAVIAIADRVEARGAALSFQSDVEYLRIVAAREGRTDNFLRALAGRPSGRISIEAHAHESGLKNYADVANILEDVVGVRNGVVGGFTASTCRPTQPAPEWEKFRAPLAPRQAGALFEATVLTDGASPGHTCDEAASGIWHPASHDDFFRDDPAQTLPNIGVGFTAGSLDEGVVAVSRLLEELRAGRLEPHRIYTQDVTIRQCTSDLAGGGASPDEVAVFLDAIEALDGPDDVIRWATYPELLEIWRTEYRGATSLWRPE